MADRDLVRKDRQSSPSAPPRGTNYLLAIAINEYLHCSKLNNAVRDAEAFIELLTTRYHFDPNHITFIKDAEATEKRIRRAFDRLIDVVTEQDNLIVYFSGHGRHHERRGGYWIPVEAGTGDDDWSDYISNSLIKDYLSKIKSFHTFLIADSCFSGSLFIDKSREKFSGDRRDTEPSRWGLTSGKREIVSDGRPGTHSPFATALLDVLRKADQPPGVMRICDLVLEKVAANAGQTPMGSPLQVPGHQGGQMVLYFREDEEQEWLELGSNAEGCRIYLTRFPSGKYRSLAEEIVAKDQEVKAWQQAKAAGVKYAFLDFERDFPNSAPVLSGELHRLLVSLEEVELWAEATQSNTVSAYRMYLLRSVLKDHVVEATEAIKTISEKERETLAWERTNTLNTIIAFEAYLRDYPQGIHAVEATEILKQLQRELEKNQTIDPPKEKEIIEVFLEAKPEDNDDQVQENEPEPNFKWQWVVGSILGLVLLLIVGNKVVGLFSNEKVNPSNQPDKELIEPDKELMAKFSNSMVLIPAGEFQMGSNGGEEDEKPVHKVSLDYFYLGKTEVTQKQWRMVMGSDPPELEFKGCDQCPVENVSWNDVQKFIKKLNVKTGENYRLPTEAEWEYAAGGGDNQTYTYAGSDALDEVGWYDGNSGSKTHPVAQKRANNFGLYDMSGNVWEWCQDWYGDYSKSPSKNPQGPTTGSGRVDRGGSWFDGAICARVAYRGYYDPDDRFDSIGFRLARRQ